MAELPTIPDDYRPDEREAYMNPMQLAYFQRKLLSWKRDLLSSSEATLSSMQEDTLQTPEAMDRISLETEKSIELRTRDRMRKLISKIDKALKKIETGDYGYCDETGDEIGIRRLEARPIATMTVEAQERHEKHERSHRDSD